MFIYTGWVIRIRVTSGLLGSGKSYVQTAWIVQEANALMFVGSDTRQNDDVLFSALKGVHASYFDFLIELLMQGTAVLHVLDQVGSLTFVRGDDADLVGLDAGFEEFGGNLLHHRGLVSIQVGGSAARYLLLA